MGEYRAPKSRRTLTEYWWFCLAHVREYNASWDYYKGMSPGEIEAHLRADAAWQRPTWPLGRLGAAQGDEVLLHDPLGILDGGSRRASPSTAPAELRDSLVTLGLGWPTTLDVLKGRYKELAKLHHPDANGGDKAAEERIKSINLAYATVRARLNEPRLAATG